MRRQHIALIGLRGAGKSTLGQRLAQELGYVFVELSRVIENLAGCSISEIHGLYGPEAYRRYERRALEDCLAQDRMEKLQAEQMKQMSENERTAAELAARERMNKADNDTAKLLAAAEMATGEKVAVSTGTGINPNP